MNNQTTLIKRKEYFGLVWLAAHHPSKINKIEIIKMDLSAKCKELTEYIVNGSAKRPKFSLLVLSHLMYGLVIILNKKNTFLYNELVTLKGMLSVTFCPKEPKEKSKSNKKVKAVDKKAITLKENIPEVFSQCSIETMELDRELELMNFQEVRLKNHKKITLDDTDDIIDRSTMIPVDYNYDMDMLGDGTGMSYMFDLNEKHLLETTGMPLSKRSSLTQAANERTPFRDLTNNAASVPRDRQKSRSTGQLNESILNPDAPGEQRKETTFNETATDMVDYIDPPNLFQETVLGIQDPLAEKQLESIDENQQQLPAGSQEFRDDIEEVVIPDGRQRPLTKSISIELKELKNNITRKHAARETAKERAVAKKSRLIIDTVTEISTSELKNRMKPAYETDQEMFAYFREKNTWLATRNDYVLNDMQLFAAPFNQDAKRTDFPMSDYDMFKRNSMRNQLVIKSKLLKTSRGKDDKYSYLTEARERVSEIANVEETTSSRVEESGQANKKGETCQKETQRKGKSLSQNVSQSNEIANEGGQKRQSTHQSVQGRNSIDQNVANQPDQGFNQPELSANQQDLGLTSNVELTYQNPLDLFDHKQLPPTEPAAVVTNLQSDIENYETIILNALRNSENAVVLQDLITDSILPARCLQTQTPRKYFAAKIFFTFLKMCGQRTIRLNQENHYDSIYMIEN